MLIRLLICLFALLPLPALAANTQAMLLSETNGISAGEPLRLGVFLEPKEGWHTYWENPGDAGMATSLVWTLPPGFTASAIDWPVPQRLTEGPLAIYAYEGKVLLPVTITPPASLDAQSYPFKVKASWLVCKEICIPESAELSIDLPAAQGSSPSLSESADLFAHNDEMRPQKIPRTLSFMAYGDKLALSLPLYTLHVHDITAAMFFPRQENLFDYAAEQKLDVFDPEAPQLTLQITGTPPPGKLSGILVITSSNRQTKYFDVDLAPFISSANHTQDKTSFVFFFLVILLALLGGLVLNLMPCVLPVLSLKCLALVKKSGSSHAVIVRNGIAYTLGIMLSFALLGAVLIALQQSGQAVGWGYQMQSPAFVGCLIYLLFVVGLSLSGVFHLPVLLGNVGSDAASEDSARGSFFTGVLATAVATPCTAPFMASAVGAALTLPAWQAMLVFEALGFGLALPFLLVSIFPRLIRFLPKPGAWMDTFKQFLAFPIYASVVWLLWVLTLQTGAGGMAMAACGMLAILAVLWMKSLFPDGSRNYRIAALILYALVLGLSLPALSRMEGTGMMGIAPDMEAVPYSPARLDELRRQGKPVFVDASAAWCITCQVNLRTAIHTRRSMEAFKKFGVTLMIADWTRRDDSITEFLRGFGYNGVPLAVYYPAHGEPKILPQLLTESTVIDTISP